LLTTDGCSAPLMSFDHLRRLGRGKEGGREKRGKRIDSAAAGRIARGRDLFEESRRSLLIIGHKKGEKREKGKKVKKGR